MTRFTEVLEDPSRELLIDQVRANSGWQRPERDAFNFGLSRSVWWLRLTVHNQADETQPYVLDLGTTQQDFVYWWVWAPSASQPEATGEIGDFLDFRQRPIKTRTLAIPLTLEPGAVREVYLRLDTSGTAFSILNLGLTHHEMFVTKERFKDLLTGVFYGLLVVSAFVGFLWFLTMFFRPVALLSVWMLAFGVYTAGYWGTDMQLFVPHSPEFLHHVKVVAGVIAIISGNAAGMSLVRIHHYVSHRTLGVLAFFSALPLVSFALAVLNDLRGTEFWTLCSGTILFLVGAVSLGELARRRITYALPLCLIYLAIASALAIRTLLLFGLVDAMPLFRDVVPLAVLATLLVLALVLATQVRAQMKADTFKQARLAMVRYVAHDIRAPQSAILALLGRAERDEVPLKLKTAIEDQVSRTVALTDAFLWLSKAESSVYRFESVYVGDVAHEAIDLVWPLLEKKQMKVERDGLDSESALISADREMLVRCVFNLLENAAKYSDSGTIVRVSLACQSAQVRLSIRDQGVGMSPEFVRHAFADYRRSKNSFVDSGFGLGLAFVATVLEQHGALIECHSQPGQGSTFVLSFAATRGLPK